MPEADLIASLTDPPIFGGSKLPPVQRSPELAVAAPSQTVGSTNMLCGVPTISERGRTRDSKSGGGRRDYFDFGLSSSKIARQAGVSCGIRLCMHSVILSRSGTNSEQSLMASSLQAISFSASVEPAWAQVGTIRQIIRMQRVAIAIAISNKKRYGIVSKMREALIRSFGSEPTSLLHVHGEERVKLTSARALIGGWTSRSASERR